MSIIPPLSHVTYPGPPIDAEAISCDLGGGFKYIKALRLFKDEPKWTPLPRTAEVDRNPYRLEYLQQMSQNGVAL